jgi:hypothetical protein
MRWLALLCLCACASAGSRQAGLVVGGTLTFAGVVIVHTADGDDLDRRLDGGSVTVIGASVLLVTLISAIVYADPPPPVPAR